MDHSDTNLNHAVATEVTHPFIVRSFGLTDRGRVRPTNEDQFVIVELSRSMIVHRTSIPQVKTQASIHSAHILLVADGMGGHQAGEVASALTVITIEDFLLNTLKRFVDLKAADAQSVLEEFQGALRAADARVFEQAAQHPQWHGMGTTLTMAFAVNWTVFVAHAGDSRCYLFSDNQLHPLTRDHTVVAELVRRGALSQQDASRHPRRHFISNAVGGTVPGVQVELHQLHLEPDDLLLLCSDGLTEMVSAKRIAAILREESTPERMCERLVAEANANGGKDNITVVVGMFKTD